MIHREVLFQAKFCSLSNSKHPNCFSIDFNTLDPLNSGHLLLELRIKDTFHTPKCTQTIHNYPNLVDARRPFSKIVHHHNNLTIG